MKGACVMKISPVTYSPVRNFQTVSKKQIQSNGQIQQDQQPSFKGWGGALGTTIGALVGIGLTVASGGTLAWLIPATSGLGGIGGDMCEDAPTTDEYGRPLYDGPSSFDYIG